MSTNALKAAATGGQVTQQREKPTTLSGLLADPKIKAQMALALPKNMTVDRLARIATTEIRDLDLRYVPHRSIPLLLMKLKHKLQRSMRYGSHFRFMSFLKLLNLELRMSSI